MWPLARKPLDLSGYDLSQDEETLMRLYETASGVDVFEASPDAPQILNRGEEDYDWRLFDVPVRALVMSTGHDEWRARESVTDPEDFEDRVDAVEDWLRGGGTLDDAPLIVFLEPDGNYPVEVADGFHRLEVADRLGYQDVPVVAALLLS